MPLKFWHMAVPKDQLVEVPTPFDLTPTRKRRQTDSNDTELATLCERHLIVPSRFDDKDEGNLIHTGHHLRPCYIDMIDTCPSTYANKSVQNACKTFLSPVCQQNEDVLATSTRYKNPYCLMCNNIDENGYTTCEYFRGKSSYTPAGYLGTLWQLLGNNTISRQRDQCPTEEIFDVYSGICRPVACAPGFQLQDRQCVVNPLLQSIIESKFCVSESNRFITGGHPDKKGAIDCVLNSLGVPVEGTRSSNVVQSLYYSHSGQLTTWDVSNHSARDIITRINSGLANKEIINELLTSCEIRTLEFIHGCRKKVHGPECSGQWFHGSPSDFRRVGNITDEAEVYLYLYDNTYISPEFTLCVLTSKLDTFLDTTVSFEECFVCGFALPALDCPLLTLYEHEYEIVQSENETQLWYANHIFHQDNYLILADGRGMICVLETQFFFAYNDWLGIVNFGGTVMSLAGLGGTFATYVVLSTLRNSHGDHMMYLTTSLFMAQLLPLITANLQVYSLLCTALAVITHFAWLASFSWMTLIAADRTYAFAYKPFNSQSGVSAFKIMPTRSFHVLGWGIPFVIVATCVVFHIAKPARIKFQYDDQQGVCWISEIRANLIAFGIPVALSVSVNLVLFMWTVYGLCKRRSESEILNQRTWATRADDCLNDTLLFMKVSVCKTDINVFFFFF